METSGLYGVLLVGSGAATTPSATQKFADLWISRQRSHARRA